MKISQLFYLLTILVFGGLGNYILWKRYGKILKKHIKFILLFSTISVIFAYWDAVALRWKAYQYNPDHTLYIRIFGGELETYIFMIVIAAGVCSATIIYADKEDSRKLRLNFMTKSRRKRR